MKYLLLLALVSCAYASNFYNTGACPDNKAAGERWFPSDSCMECYCDHNGYGCTGCTTVTPFDGCYTIQDKAAQYPACCPRLTCPPLLPPTE